MTDFRYPTPDPGPSPVAPVIRPGDIVEIISGRYRGWTGPVVAVESVSTPGGGIVTAFRFDRPRSGETWEFTACARIASETSR